MSFDYMANAFKELNILSEDTFDLTDDGIQGLRTLKETDVEADDTIDIIDPEADSSSELQPSYDGKVILECPICHSFLFNDKDAIEIDKTTELANVNEECPYCCELGGFGIIGQVAPFDNAEDIDDVDSDEEEVETEEEEEIEDISDDADEDTEEEVQEESIEVEGDEKEEVTELLEPEDCDGDICEEDDCKDGECEISDEDIKSALDEAFGKDGWSSCEMSESAPYSVKVSNGDEVLGEYYYVENKLVKALPESLTVTADEGETVISSDTDNTVVTVTNNAETSEPVSDFSDVSAEEEVSEVPAAEDSEKDEETVVELSDEEKSEIENNNEVEESVEPKNRVIDRELTDLDEEAFNNLGTRFLRRTYENVNSFAVSNVYADDNTMILEGVITFKSGKTKNSRFKFESKDTTNSGKVRFVGENLNISTAKKAFTVTGTLSEGKFVAESLNYNFSAKNPEGKSARVYGTVSNRK